MQKSQVNYLSLANTQHSLESYISNVEFGVTQTPLQAVIIIENSYRYIGVGYFPTPDGTKTS